VAVRRGPLRITVTEGGDLESGRPVSVRSELEGRAAILDIVAEGTQVKKGDWLARLDAASIQDNLNRAEIKVEEGRSQVAQAEEEVAIQRRRNEEEEKAASTGLELARRALSGFQEGTYKVEMSRLRSQHMLAEEKLARARKEAEASQRLAEKNYISQNELDADILALKQAHEEVAIAALNLDHFEKWTAPDEIKKLTSEVEVKELAYQRVQQQARSELKQKVDALEARRKNYQLEIEARDKLAAQLAKANLYAPSDGLVVYARQERGGRMGGSEPIGLGKEVREQEEILRIPDLSSMMVKVDIHESSIKKVRTGQRAWVKVDAIPGETLAATVQRVSLVPSTQSSWMNPDLKVYETWVQLDQVLEEMKPGMHAQVEILVQEIPDALQVPVQSVRQVGARSFVYVRRADAGAELREVKIGLSNRSHVHVQEGLAESEQVYLTPPPDAPPLPEPEPAPELPSLAEAPVVPPVPEVGAPGGVRPGATDDGNLPLAPPGGETDGRRADWMERMRNLPPEERERLMEEMRRRRAEGGEGRGARRDGGRRNREASPTSPPGGEER
jgi:HlyD family secretion protein